MFTSLIFCPTSPLTKARQAMTKVAGTRKMVREPGWERLGLYEWTRDKQAAVRKKQEDIQVTLSLSWRLLLHFITLY